MDGLKDYAVLVRPDGVVNAYELADYESRSNAGVIGEWVSAQVVRGVPNMGAAIWKAAVSSLENVGQAIGEVLETWLFDKDWCVDEEQVDAVDLLSGFAGKYSPLNGSVKLYNQELCQFMWVTKMDYDRNPSQWGEDWVRWEDWLSKTHYIPANPDQLPLEGI